MCATGLMNCAGNNICAFNRAFFIVVKQDGVFEYGHVLFGPVGEMAEPEFFVGQGNQFKNFAAVFDVALNVHQAGEVKAAHVFFPGKEQQHVVPFAFNFNHDFVAVAALKLVRLSCKNILNNVYRIVI